LINRLLSYDQQRAASLIGRNSITWRSSLSYDEPVGGRLCIIAMQYCCNTPHTHTRLTALFPGLPRWTGTRKVKPVWILLKQETVSGSGISWAICKLASCSRQTTTPAPHHSVFTGRMPFLPPNQQCQSTEDNCSTPHVNVNQLG